MAATLQTPAPATSRETIVADRFGNPFDPIVKYARGTILRGSAQEIRRMLKARDIVGTIVRRDGANAVHDLSGMNRGGGLGADDVAHLTSHVPFFAHFQGHTEPLALRHMGAEDATHGALILNRVSAANFISLTTLLTRGDRVYALAPAGGISHPSTVRPVAMAGASYEEFHDVAELERAWRTNGAPRLLLITPISASKRHLPFEDFRRALRLPRAANTLAYVDDAHMASRIAFFDEPRTFEVGAVDIAVCSADKHVAGPRAGVLVARKDLLEPISSAAYELGLEAQAGQYVGVANALRDFDGRAVKEAGALAVRLIDALTPKYGAHRVYLGGPGISIQGDDVIQIAMERLGRTDKPQLVAVEAAGIAAMEMLEHDGVLTIGAVAMPGSAPVLRLMMYPDGPRLGLERIVQSLEHGIERVAQVIYDEGEARRQLLGD